MTDMDIVGVPWDQFLSYMRDNWKQGQHMAVCGPTGKGKTVFASQLMKIRQWTVTLDAKGGDSSLDESGLTRIADWPPPRHVLDAIAEGRPAQLVVGFTPRSLAEWDALQRLLEKTLDEIWTGGNWTVRLDEFQLLSDRKMMNLGKRVEMMLVAARDKRISVVSLFQAPAWVPKAATRQASYVVLYKTTDVNVIKILAEAVGRPWQELAAAMRKLPKWHCLVFTTDPDEPVILTSAPPLD